MSSMSQDLLARIPSRKDARKVKRPIQDFRGQGLRRSSQLITAEDIWDLDAGHQRVLQRKKAGHTQTGSPAPHLGPGEGIDV